MVNGWIKKRHLFNQSNMPWWICMHLLIFPSYFLTDQSCLPPAIVRTDILRWGYQTFLTDYMLCAKLLSWWKIYDMFFQHISSLSSHLIMKGLSDILIVNLINSLTFKHSININAIPWIQKKIIVGFDLYYFIPEVFQFLNWHLVYSYWRKTMIYQSYFQELL